jgi:hypothetical protein
MKLRLRARVYACAVILGLCTSATAYANFTCEGQIAYLGLTSDGSINLSVGFGIWGICSMTSTTNGNGGVIYTPEGCRAWYAAFLAAQKANQPIRLYFSSSANTSNGPECSALGNWVSPTPAAYFMVVL